MERRLEIWTVISTFLFIVLIYIGKKTANDMLVGLSMGIGTMSMIMDMILLDNFGEN